MRSMGLLVLALGLLAVAKAADEQQHLVLLEGANWPMPALDELPAADADAAHSGHHHRKHPHLVNPPSSLEDMERLLHCAKRAVRAFKDGHPEDAAKILAYCVHKFWDTCHGTPQLPAEWANTIPGYLLLHGMEALYAEGSLDHATAVVKFYLIGGQNVPGNIWYNPPPFPGGCAAKLTNLLHLGATTNNEAIIKALAKVVVQILADIRAGIEPQLGDCAPDVPAVLLSLASVYCPTVPPSKTGTLYNPLNPAAPITCTNNGPAQPLYENGAGAQLVGSVISLLLLSNKPALQELALEVTFAALRMAQAASQFNSFTTCLGGLSAKVQSIPPYSGKLGPAGSQLQAYTPLPLGLDGTRTLCATIAAVAGGPAWTTAQASLPFQASINVANAIAMAAKATSATPQVKAGICAFLNAVSTFQGSVGNPNVPAPRGTLCLATLGASVPGCLPPWMTIVPVIAGPPASPPHSFDVGSYVNQICT